MFGKETQEWQENNGIYTATEDCSTACYMAKKLLLR